MNIRFRCLSLAVLVAGGLSAPPQTRAEAPTLMLSGQLEVVPIERRRIVIGIDTNHDGLVDHLFLYTSSQQRPQVEPRIHAPGTIHYVEGVPAVVTVQSMGRTTVFSTGNEPATQVPDPKNTFPQRLMLSQGIGINHVVPPVQIRVTDLAQLAPEASCDRYPQSCLKVAGFFLPFPG